MTQTATTTANPIALNYCSDLAEELFVSPRTVETHMENIKNKLGCNKKSEVITFLFKNGFAEKFLPEICAVN